MFQARPNIDIEAMMDKAPTPNRLRAPTPIRKGPARMLPNKENMIADNGLWSNDNPGKLVIGADNLNKKPLISPVRNVPMGERAYEQPQPVNYRGNARPAQHNYAEAEVCINHGNKPAEFTIQIQDQCMSYCGRCAAQLASQGFQVCKIEPATIKKADSRARNQGGKLDARHILRYPEYEGKLHYELLTEFLGQLQTIQGEHSDNMTRLSQIDNGYNQQIEQTNYFYSELISFIERMRNDHLSDLEEESRKHSQIADIQHDYLRENMEEINIIKADIEENMDTIVNDIGEEELKGTLNEYRLKLQVYRHKIEEQEEFFEKVISFTPEQYESKLKRVEDFLMDVWAPENDQKSSKKVAQKFIPPVQQKPVPVRLPAIDLQPDLSNRLGGPARPPRAAQIPKKLPTAQSGEAEKQPAFRKLFDEEEQVMAQTSPQFKKI